MVNESDGECVLKCRACSSSKFGVVDMQLSNGEGHCI